MLLLPSTVLVTHFRGHLCRWALLCPLPTTARALHFLSRKTKTALFLPRPLASKCAYPHSTTGALDSWCHYSRKIGRKKNSLRSLRRLEEPSTLDPRSSSRLTATPPERPVPTPACEAIEQKISSINRCTYIFVPCMLSFHSLTSIYFAVPGTFDFSLSHNLSP